MSKRMLRAEMARFGDTQDSLSEAMGTSRSRLNAKINQKRAEFTQSEMRFIKERYTLSAEAAARMFLEDREE